MIGKQKGRKIEVMNSFELLFDLIEGEIIVNMEYYNTKEEQCRLQICDCYISPSTTIQQWAVYMYKWMMLIFFI